MIKVGITGAETRQGGELMRILINHPDVDIISVHSPSNAGRPVASVHHGFIGEERLLFSSVFDATALDVAFVISPLHSGSDWAKLMSDRPGLKVMFFPESAMLAEGFDRMPVYGLSEINRKQLVRGARSAVLPDPVASVSLVGLYPLARHLMLPERLEIKASLPVDLITDERLKRAKSEIAEQILLAQTSFSGNIEIVAEESGSERGMAVETTIAGTTPLDEIFKVYDSIYDDHNFAHIVAMDVDYKEVEGTDKCIISLSKPTPDTIRIRTVADPRMRGGAGEAVHLLNLLCGLYEKTGLSLKANRY